MLFIIIAHKMFMSPGPSQKSLVNIKFESRYISIQKLEAVEILPMLYCTTLFKRSVNPFNWKQYIILWNHHTILRFHFVSVLILLNFEIYLQYESFIISDKCYCLEWVHITWRYTINKRMSDITRAYYQIRNIAGRTCAGNAGNVFLATAD